MTRMFKGHPRQHLSPEGMLCNEFMERKRLAALGFTSPLGELPSTKAIAFILIDGHLETLIAKEKEKARKRFKLNRKG